MLQIELKEANKILRHKSPDEIINWALTISKRRIVTTSFGVYSAVLLSTFNKIVKDIDVVWCDTGFNNSETYKHANNLIKRFSLNIHIYSPLVSAAYLQSLIGIPTLENPKHDDFSELVKLEPFRRALKKHKPVVWFTNIRNRQTEFRNSRDILSFSKDGILKVSPYFYWTDDQLDDYLKKHNLPKNVNYFDPTKVLVNRECGIHLQ
ncbi:MAG: phosphoadenosine phosphosulfate reductase family protein [Flavobacteriaceae bacterium]|nr:phosphoadenosine phosphosulfate reductase family protein [Flavobacteriaceae bacterium]